MKTALLRNLGAKVRRESMAASSAASTGGAARTQTQTGIDLDAVGQSNGQAMLLRGHFVAKGNRFYQVIVMGPERSVPSEQVDQFISSFKPL